MQGGSTSYSKDQTILYTFQYNNDTETWFSAKDEQGNDAVMNTDIKFWCDIDCHENYTFQNFIILLFIDWSVKRGSKKFKHVTMLFIFFAVYI